MNEQEKAYKRSSTASANDDNLGLKDYYDVLNVEKNASFKEIREAFFRLKNTYNCNNQALYSLLEHDDLEESVEDINEAYSILSNPETRLAYDRDLVESKLATESEIRGDIAMNIAVNKTSPSGSSRLGASATTWGQEHPPDLSFGKEFGGAHSFQEEINRNSDKKSGFSEVNSSFVVTPRRRYGLAGNVVRKAIAPAALETDIQEKVSELITDGDLGDGSLYKRIRQLVGVSKEEMQDHIKISIGYIDNLEENRFDLLPQPVYVKGFLKSYLRFLGVSACDDLIKAYAERLNDWIEKKSS